MVLRIKNCKITVSFFLVAFLALVSFIDLSGNILIGVLAVIIHELGHLTAMYIFDSLPQSINLGLCNIGICDRLGELRSKKKNAVIFLSGPLNNLLFALISLVLFCSFGTALFYRFMLVNVALALFNLLPIESLDGGGLLFLLLCKFSTYEKAQKISIIISLIFAIPLFFFGFFVLLSSKYNFSLLLISCILLYNILLYKKQIWQT